MSPYGADGIFGEKTEQAVKAFQSVHLYQPGEKLMVDGIVGPKTWGALDWWAKNPSGYNGHNDFYDVVRAPTSQSSANQAPATNPAQSSLFLERIYRNQLVTFNDVYLGVGGGWRTINAWLKVIFGNKR